MEFIVNVVSNLNQNHYQVRVHARTGAQAEIAAQQRVDSWTSLSRGVYEGDINPVLD